MARKAKRVICLAISLFLCSCNILVSKAEALPEVLSGSTTLADNIMSYYALSGSAVANTDWINTLYNSYGTSFGTVEELANQGYLVLNDAGVWQPTQALGEMIEQAPAYTSLGLNDIFNVSAEEVAAGGGYAAASGGSILAGSLGGVASTGALTLFGGVTAAYWGGIAIGTLATHILQKYAPWIYGGVPISNDDVTITQLLSGGAIVAYAIHSAGYTYYVGANNVYSFVYKDNGSVHYGLYNNTLDRISGKWLEVRNSTGSTTSQNTINVSGKGTYENVMSESVCSGAFAANRFNSASAFNSALTSWKNGTATPKTNNSPDIIGENGNQSATKDGNSYSVPDIKPMIDPGQQAGKPLTMQDWLNFANSVQNNNNQTSPEGGSNGDLYNGILDRLVIPSPVPNPNPDPDPDPNPYPDPHPNPDPDQVPVPDYQDPEQETQPDYDSETETVPDPENGKPWVTPNLLDKFPFCIPKDLMNMANNFNSGTRQAPEIEWRFNPPYTPIDYTFHLDLEDFEAVAVLLRTLELALFVVGLAFATRYLIGAS